MPEGTMAAPSAAPSTPAPSSPAAAPPAAPAAGDRLAAANRALRGEAPPAPAAPVMPSTPDAPATAAILAAEDTATSLSALIRQRNEALDRIQGFDGERAKFKNELAAAREQAKAEFKAELRAAYDGDPRAFHEAMESKRDPLELARDLYLANVKLEDLPPEQRAALEAKREYSQLKREQEKLRAEIEQSKTAAQQAQLEQGLRTWRSQMASGLKELSDETPIMKQLGNANPDAAVQMLENLAGTLALNQPQLGVQTLAQLAARLEETLAAELKTFEPYYERKYKAPAAPAATPPKAAAAPQPVGEDAPTLSTSLGSSTPTSTQPRSNNERLSAAREYWKSIHKS